ncbi:hypothetical protein ACFQH6_10910 [Halobacteriaceae archaeon GCM10025711]
MTGTVFRPLGDGRDPVEVVDGDADLARDGLVEPLADLLGELALLELLAELCAHLVALLGRLLYLRRRLLLLLRHGFPDLVRLPGFPAKRPTVRQIGG